MIIATTGYLADEATYTKYTQHTIGATTYPSTGDNWETWNDYFSDILNAKIGVSANVTDDPPVKVCRFIVATWIRRAGILEEARNAYTSPEQRLSVLPPTVDMTPEDDLLSVIIGYLDTEDAPAYHYAMRNRWRTGSYL